MQNVRGRLQRRRMNRFISGIIAFILTFCLVIPPQTTLAQNFGPGLLPAPGTMVAPTQGFVPTLIKGIEFHPENPFQLDFIIHTGEESLRGEALNTEALRVIKYFLASLTVPEDQMWVNLSPYEQDRIIPEAFGQTGMGLDLLAEDYLLKQLTASLMYPEEDLGKKFWQRIKERAKAEYGLTQLPMDAFHKVWIVAKDAQVLEQGSRAFVINSSLEVLTEEDYTAAKEMLGQDPSTTDAPKTALSQVQSEVMREMILPEIEREVNEGKSFARLRQIYSAMILAAWFKITLRESLLGQVYVDQNKTTGVEGADQALDKNAVYQQYLKAFEQGVYNYIREEQDPETGEVIPRQYFSGGASPNQTRDGSMLSDRVAQSLVRPEQVSLYQKKEILTALVAEPDQEGRVVITRVDLKDPNLDERQAALNFIRRKYSNLPDLGGNLLLRLLAQVVSHDFLVHDITLEAILPELEGLAQLAQGKGGLGFLAGETFGAYPNALGMMPLYDKTKDGRTIDWREVKNVHRLTKVSEDGQERGVTIPIQMGGETYNVDYYWMDRKGTPVFFAYHPAVFNELYPDPQSGQQRMLQYALIGKSYVALMNYLGMNPDIVRLNEAQLVFAQKALENDIKKKGDKSIFAKSKTVMTNHTPERAAIPIFDQQRAWLEGLLGSDLVDDSMYQASNGTVQDVINAADVLGRAAEVVTTVSKEHGEVTKRRVLPQFAWKTAYVQNGSDPTLWRTPMLQRLIEDKGYEHVTGKDLFDIGQVQKGKLNRWLGENGYHQFDDTGRPLFAAVRRLVDYKEQGLFFALLDWVTGDTDKDYQTPWGETRKGLGANVLFGGPMGGGANENWVREFKRRADGDLKGRLVFVDRTGTDIMKLSVAAADGWLVSPVPTREASGTSDQRAMFNGTLVLASATGGPLVAVDNGKNGWLIDVFKTGGFTESFDEVVAILDDGGHPKFAEYRERYRVEAQKLFGQAMAKLVELYNAHQSSEDGRILDMMERSFHRGHEVFDINVMMAEYQRLFRHVLNGTGAAGYESRQIPAKSHLAVSSDGVLTYVEEKYEVDDQRSVLEDFLKGTRSLVDAMNTILRQDTEMTEEQARAVVVSTWISEAYGIGEDKFSTLEAVVLGEYGDKQVIAGPLGISEMHAEYLLQDVLAFEMIQDKENALRQIDEDRANSRYVAPEKQHQVREQLGRAWQSIEDRREALKKAEAVDAAGLVKENKANKAATPTGGIDFAAGFLNLQIKRDQSGMPLPAAQQPMQKLMTIEGLTPVIIQIAPVQNLPLLMGLEPDEDSDDSGSANRLSRLDVLDRTQRHRGTRAQKS